MRCSVILFADGSVGGSFGGMGSLYSDWHIPVNLNGYNAPINLIGNNPPQEERVVKNQEVAHVAIPVISSSNTQREKTAYKFKAAPTSPKAKEVELAAHAQEQVLHGSKRRKFEHSPTEESIQFRV